MNGKLYQLNPENTKEAPKAFIDKLKFLGPGFILSASIVGSGELIATTTLGAKAGFVTLWIILISCLIKVSLQLEFGKHTILHGETAMVAFNRLPGKRLKKAHWSVWSFLFIMVVKFTQLGGIIGGVAIALNIAFPFIGIYYWAVIATIAVGLIVSSGKYKYIEKISIGMIALFTLLTFISLYFLQFTPYPITWPQLATGLSFNLPPEAALIALGAFGITGVGGDEIIHYTYWCMEKGYAAFTGPKEDTVEWRQRANGWISVMKLDALVSMIVYTLMTGAFYLLGAAILHGKQDIPQGFALIESLSNMYTETLGDSAKMAFLIGAIIVLFSTLFSALAAWTRQFADIFSIIGWFDFKNPIQRIRMIRILAWVIPFGWLLFFVFIKLPVGMIIFGGVVTSVILLFVVYAALYFRYKMTHSSFIPLKIYDYNLWLSVVVIIAVAIYGIWSLL